MILMQTTFLFALPSLLSGMARVLDIGGQFDSYNESKKPETADAMALYSDFKMVGQDMQTAMESVIPDINFPVNPDQLEFDFRKRPRQF